jgi:CRP/FNR family transcriptional regulator
VASWLLKHSDGQNPVSVTHQEIASDLGSSREVVSRILEDFQHEGLIEPGRGTVEILDLEGLENRIVM